MTQQTQRGFVQGFKDGAGSQFRKVSVGFVPHEMEQIAKMAAEADVPFGSMVRAIVTQGLKRRDVVNRAKNPFVFEWSPKVQADWEGPRSLKWIADRHGVDPGTIRRAAIRAGQYPRPKRAKAVSASPKRSVKPIDALTPAQLEDVSALRKAGFTLKEAIAKVTAPKAKIRFATSKGETA